MSLPRSNRSGSSSQISQRVLYRDARSWNISPPVSQPSTGLEVHPRRHPSFSIGKGPRTDFYPRGGSPGPGSYESRSGPAGPQHRIVGRNVDPASHGITPGPATYSPDFRLQLAAQIHAYTIAGRRRASAESGMMNGPGPAEYSVSMKRARLGGKFSREQRAHMSRSLNSFPGPAEYDSVPRRVVSTYGTAPKYTFGSEKKLAKSAGGDNLGCVFPGPGEYKLRAALCRKGGKLSKSPRSSAVTQGRNVPGPGSYNTCCSDRRAPSFRCSSP